MPEQLPISVPVHQSNGKLPASSTLVHGHTGYQISSNNSSSQQQLTANHKQPNHCRVWVHQQEWKSPLTQYMCDNSNMLTLCLLFYAFNVWIYCRPSFLSVDKRSVKFTAIHRNVDTILQYSPSTTYLYHVLSEISTCNYTEGAAVCHSVVLHVSQPCPKESQVSTCGN